jgi:hypothetical protein
MAASSDAAIFVAAASGRFATAGRLGGNSKVW